VEEVLNGEERKGVTSLLQFFKEMNIKFIEDADSIKIMGNIVEMDFDKMQFELRTFDGNFISFKNLVKGIIITVSNLSGEKSQIIPFEFLISYKNGSLIIKY